MIRRTAATAAGSLLAALAAALPAHAAGSAAGSVIVNQAAVSCQIGGHEVIRLSNPAQLTVDEKLDLTLTWLDSACATVEPGTSQAMLTYRLINTGNGNEAFALTVTNSIPGDQFDPARASIYLDSNGNDRFDAGDRPYDPANPPLLAADAALLVFTVSDIPAPLQSGDRGVSRLTATAVTGSGAPSTTFPPQTPGGTGAVVGASGALASAGGCYQTGERQVLLAKTAVVADQNGGSKPMSGAVITYRIGVTVDGPAPAIGLVVSDTVPEHTIYLPGSLRLEAAAGSVSLTDAVDGDRGQISESPPGSGHLVVEFPLGDLPPGNYTVTFQVTIL